MGQQVHRDGVAAVGTTGLVTEEEFPQPRRSTAGGNKGFGKTRCRVVHRKTPTRFAENLATCLGVRPRRQLARPVERLLDKHVAVSRQRGPRMIEMQRVGRTYRDKINRLRQCLDRWRDLDRTGEPFAQCRGIESIWEFGCDNQTSDPESRKFAQMDRTNPPGPDNAGTK